MEKLDTGHLIRKLVALLREADPDKFDDAVVEARSQLTAEQKQSKRNDLEKLFDSQIATLEDRGSPERIVEELQSQKNAVVQKASDMAIGEWNIPFLPVIKPAYLGYYGLMVMVRSGRKAGYIYMKPAAITDQFETPDDLYYIHDVEDGSSTRGKSPKEAEKILKSQKRSPLTAAEVVNLCILRDVLSRHSVWAAGSRCESDDGVPIAYLDLENRPLLSRLSVDDAFGLWGSASCGSR